MVTLIFVPRTFRGADVTLTAVEEKEGPMGRHLCPETPDGFLLVSLVNAQRLIARLQLHQRDRRKRYVDASLVFLRMIAPEQQN
ncbi:GAF domain-containing protein [Streptomyces specialis]|uniref:hypothetical protein n=1 Tax=Streptomyces specialis TaxID=498367 RepID=UPI00131B6A88|nr:hypothetical protein [Streptomyces specialis]